MTADTRISLLTMVYNLLNKKCEQFSNGSSNLAIINWLWFIMYN